MLENQERNWEVHTLKKRRKEIEVERQIQGVAWEIHLSIYSILRSTYQSVIFSHINLQER